MGWFDGASEVNSHHSGHSHSHSHSHSGGRKKQSTSQSFFGLGTSHHNSSRSSFFGGRSNSYYKRSSRKGYLNKLYQQLRRLLRDLLYYLKKNPVKVFFLVIMPLITGGALTALLSRFGVRLPPGVERMIAQLGGRSGHGGLESGLGRGHDGHLQFERKSYDGPLGSMGSTAGSLLSAARMFM